MMAYDTQELIEQALKAIQEHDLVFIDEVVSYLPCSVKTFNNHKLHELPSIKDALESNKINVKQYLRREWRTSDSATERIALYKLLASEHEFARLSGSKHEISSGNISINLTEAK